MGEAMSQPEKRRVGVGVGVVVTRDAPGSNQVLLVQRRYHGARTWSTVGGYIDPGESPEASCVREVREESGLTIRDPVFACLTNDVHDDGKHNVTLWFTAEPDDPDEVPILSSESLAIGWFRWDELPADRYLSFQNYLEGPTWPAHRGGQRLPEDGV
jgi:8-oxo-dGTP diphosphatase